MNGIFFSAHSALIRAFHLLGPHAGPFAAASIRARYHINSLKSKRGIEMVISQTCFCVSLVAHGSRHSDEFCKGFILFYFIVLQCMKRK